MKKMLLLLCALPSINLQAASDSWYFRGTANYWKTTGMTPDGAQWFITVDFAREEDSASFRIDHYGDWQEAYPKRNFPVQDCSRYTIRFQPKGRIVTVERIGAVTTGSCAQRAAAAKIEMKRMISTAPFTKYQGLLRSKVL